MMFSAVVGPWIIRLVYPIFLLFLCCCIYECCFQDILIFICFVTYSLVILINAYSVSQGWLWRSLLDMSHPSLLVNAFIGIYRQKPSPVLRRNDLPQAGAAKLFLLPTAFVTRGSCTPGQERMGSWKGKDGLMERFISDPAFCNLGSELLPGHCRDLQVEMRITSSRLKGQSNIFQVSLVSQTQKLTLQKDSKNNLV